MEIKSVKYHKIVSEKTKMAIVLEVVLERKISGLSSPEVFLSFGMDGKPLLCCFSEGSIVHEEKRLNKREKSVVSAWVKGKCGPKQLIADAFEAAAAAEARKKELGGELIRLSKTEGGSPRWVEVFNAYNELIK